MTELLWVRSHVEQLLQRERDVCRVAVDRDGDFPFRCGTAAGWVAVLDEQPIVVRVTAHAVYGVRSSAKLLRELNEINVRALTATVQLIDDIVIVQQTILPTGLTQPVLAQAVHAVGGVADDIGGLLAAMFDGTTPHEPRGREICTDPVRADDDGRPR